MKHNEVIKPEYIDQYIETHKMLYRNLSIMISDINFLLACINTQDHALDYDGITIKYLYRTVFETLILRAYRTFFDNSGSDTNNLLKFKNSIIGSFLKDEYKDGVLQSVNTTHIEDKTYKNSILPNLRDNIIRFRTEYIAHGLLKPTYVEVDLRDLKQLVEYGCELFQALSFEPDKFYHSIEGDGFDFSREWKYTEKSLESFIRYTMLSSCYIDRIDCTISSSCNPSVRDKIQDLVDDINNDKSSNIP